jgi:hypothetical protein
MHENDYLLSSHTWNNYYIDGSPPAEEPMKEYTLSYINGDYGDGDLVNCKFDHEGQVYTTKRIQKGDQLFLAYGDSYNWCNLVRHMLSAMVRKINKLAAHTRLNRVSSIPDLHICNTQMASLTDDAIENGSFQQGTDEILVLLVNAIQGRHVVAPQAPPSESSPTKDWILWLLSKGPFMLWTCRQTDGELILAQARLTTEEVYSSIFTIDSGTRHSKRIKERHDDEHHLANEEAKPTSVSSSAVAQSSDAPVKHRTHTDVDDMTLPPAKGEAPIPVHRDINTFLGSEARQKATDKKKFKYMIGSPPVGTLRIGAVQINSLNYDKLCEIIPIWKKEKYDYLAITDTRCTDKEVVHLKKLLRQLNPGDAYWFCGVTEQKMAGGFLILQSARLGKRCQYYEEGSDAGIYHSNTYRCGREVITLATTYWPYDKKEEVQDGVGTLRSRIKQHQMIIKSNVSPKDFVIAVCAKGAAKAEKLGHVLKYVRY